MRYTIQRVLVATSLTEASDPVVRAAHVVAKRTGATLRLFHAARLPAAYYGSPLGMTAVQPRLLKTQLERSRVEAQEQMRRIGIEEAAWHEVMVDVGAPHRMLLEAAQTFHPDLLMVGGSESHGPLAPLLGSTAERVLRRSTCPVLVVRGALSLPLKHVLAPVDLSPLSQQALRTGIDILEQLSAGASPSIEALFVLDPFDREGMQFTPQQVDRFAGEEFDRFLAGLGPIGLPAIQPTLRTGLPREEIMHHLGEHPAELLMLGSHGRGGFQRMLLGSVASYVSHRVKTSVLIVPPAGG